ILAFGADVSAPIPSGLLLEACYYHAIGFAVQAGFPRLSLGTCRPILSDGVLRYKRKWGGRLGRPRAWEAFRLHHPNTAATRAALTAAPLVLDRGRGRLAALMGVVGRDTAEHVARVETPGLAEIALLADAGAPVDPPLASTAPLRLVPAGAIWPPEAAPAV